MVVNELSPVVADSVSEVLESMFFTSPTGEAEPGATLEEPTVSATLSFRGDPSGTFGVRVSLETARKMAATFLGREEETLTQTETGEVVSELANMLCGSVLSSLEKDTRFELAQPKIESPEAGWQSHPGPRRMFELEEGLLAVWLHQEQPG